MANVQMADLVTVRSQTSFDPRLLTSVLWPDGRRQLLDGLVEIMSKEPLFEKDYRRHLSRQQLLEHGYAIQLRLMQLRRLHGWDLETFNVAMQLIDDHIPYGLHFNAFMPVLQSQGSDEQIKQWLPKCLDMSVIGCYAQTELGHGSNVQGLETTATFDKGDQTFVIHSPTLTSAKWWVGGLGTVANHAVVQAQLILNGKNLGPHLFIVQLRDPNTHRPLAGIKIGDIGPKHYGGFNMNDNGFATFDNVKIPHSNFLCRYAKVSSDGKYSPAGHAKIGYGSMVALRAGMPTVLGLELGKCVTIAIRYTTVRRQFSMAAPKVTDKVEDASKELPSESQREMQVIKYSSVKERLVPLLAASYCYVLAGHSTMTLYKTMLAALVKPPHDASLLAEVHLLTSGLKAVLSWNVVAGMEEARKALGGHGFSIYSGIGERFAKEVPGQTYEGDNYVLVQQTAKGLLKNAGLLSRGKVDKMMESTRFLAKLPTKPQTSEIDWTDRSTQLTILGSRVGALLKDLARRAAAEPWHELNMECVRLTRAFIDHYTATMFCQQIAQLSSMDKANKSNLEKLASVFILDALKSGIADLAEYTLVPNRSISVLRRASSDAINSLEPDLIGLTDAYQFSDWELNSVLGRADGDVYRQLWKTVNEKNPVNTSREQEVVKSYNRLLKPLHAVANGTAKALL